MPSVPGQSFIIYEMLAWYWNPFNISINKCMIKLNKKFLELCLENMPDNSLLLGKQFFLEVKLDESGWIALGK